jgi:hypothetical protein
VRKADSPPWRPGRSCEPEEAKPGIAGLDGTLDGYQVALPTMGSTVAPVS